MPEKETRNGLEVARAFFQEWGLPQLERQFPDLVTRVAAGRLRGSDVLEADDEVSQDHSWGPQFWLFFNDADYARFGNQVSEQLNAIAPNPWQGHRLAGGGDKAVMVVSLSEFIKGMVGLDAPPQNPRDWIPISTPTPCALPSESNLYFLRHGAVFYDPLGELTSWRESLRVYPHDIWLRRLAEETFRIWHHGEYNFVHRMTRRRDPLAIQICLAEFTTGIMRLWLLLSNDYTPYWKWLAHEFRKLPESSEVEPLLMQVAGTSDIAEQAEVVREICSIAHARILASGLVTGKGISPVAQYLLPLLNDFEELTALIKDNFWKL